LIVPVLFGLLCAALGVFLLRLRDVPAERD
jgi:hypothetical protein